VERPEADNRDGVYLVPGL